MTKIDIFSGFLGAGKTTLIKKLIAEAYCGEKLVLIENEFGEIGIDGGFLKDAGIEITEMNSGCICCSLVGDFSEALAKVLDELRPDRIIIEPSGVGKLSDVIRAVRTVEREDARLNSFTTVADVNKCRMYMKNFGEFYNDQIANASAIVLSHTGGAREARIAESVELVRQHNAEAVIVTTPWEELDGRDILAAIERANTLEDELSELENDAKHHHHHHHEHGEGCGCHEHHHEHGEDCGCHGHHHEHGEDCGCHEHHHEHGEGCGCHEHHHDHGEDCGCHEHHHEHGEDCGCHEHHHEHGEDCGCHEHHHEHGEDCGCHEHHHEHGEHCDCGCHDHGHHHADDVFASWGAETARKFTEEEIRAALESFSEGDEYGMILRAKGIVASVDSRWIHFDYIPGEVDIRYGSAAVIGRLCVIGSGIDKEKIKELFGV